MLRMMLALSLFVLSGLVPSIPDDRSIQAAVYEDAEAYKVYAAMLPEEWPWRVAKAPGLTIRTETEPYEMCVHPEIESDQVQEPLVQAIDDYKKANKQPWLLQRHFEVNKPYELISQKEITATFAEGAGIGWQTFNSQHPDSHGWIELSAVGFDASKTLAILYVGHHCGGLCGGGTFHVLQKTEGKWTPIKLKGRSCWWAS